MNPLEDIRIGNIIDYTGPVVSRRPVQVLAIEPLGDGQVFYTLKGLYDDKSFAGYEENIRPIYLEDRHLRAIGLLFDAETRRFGLGLNEIARFGYAEGPASAATLVDLGFRIVPSGFPTVPTIQQMKDLPTLILYLHNLQNYCADNGIDGIDFSAIRY